MAEQRLTDKGKHMPREIADTIDIRRHERHDLRFAREIVFVVFATIGFVPVLAVVDAWRRRCDIFAHERLAEQDCVQLDTYTHLDSRRRERE